MCAELRQSVEGGATGLSKAQGLLRDHGNHRAGRASGREYLPSEKERRRVVSNLSVPEFWALALPTRPGVGEGGWGWSQELFKLPLGGPVGRGGPCSVVSSLREVSPGPGVSTAHGEGKTYPRKSQFQMSPRPAPHPHSPASQHPGLCTQPGDQKPPPLGLPKAMAQGWKGEAGGCGGLCLGPSICLSTGGSLSVS